MSQGYSYAKKGGSHRNTQLEIGKMHDCHQFEEGDELGGEAERAGAADLRLGILAMATSPKT
jgi:hypothetical protein